MRAISPPVTAVVLTLLSLILSALIVSGLSSSFGRLASALPGASSEIVDAYVIVLNETTTRVVIDNPASVDARVMVLFGNGTNYTATCNGLAFYPGVGATFPVENATNIVVPPGNIVLLDCRHSPQLDGTTVVFVVAKRGLVYRIPVGQ